MFRKILEMRVIVKQLEEKIIGVFANIVGQKLNINDPL